MIISVCGPLGYEKARKLYNEHKVRIEERFPSFFLEQFEAIRAELIRGEPDVEREGVKFCTGIGSGGIYGALWQAGEQLGCGMKIVNSAIPIRQEVIEILELFDESPYECDSEGSWLLVTDIGTEAISFSGMTYPLSAIGITTDDNSRILEDKDAVRYLTPPARQKKDISARNADRNRFGREGIY